jgi:hypothetical protein
MAKARASGGFFFRTVQLDQMDISRKVYQGLSQPNPAVAPLFLMQSFVRTHPAQ